MFVLHHNSLVLIFESNGRTLPFGIELFVKGILPFGTGLFVKEGQ